MGMKEMKMDSKKCNLGHPGSLHSKERQTKSPASAMKTMNKKAEKLDKKMPSAPGKTW